MKYKILILIFFSTNCFCQISTDGLQISENNKLWFDSQIGDEKNAITVGVGEKIVVKAKKTSPFINRGRWFRGDVQYRNEVFQNTQLLFDLYENRLFTKNTSTFYPIKLNKSQIDWFKFNDIVYERHEVPKIEGEKSKFLEVIYKGRQTSLYYFNFRKLRIQNGVSQYYDGQEIWLEDVKNNNYYRIKRKRDLKKLFPENKKDLSSFFRNEGILFLRKASKNKLQILASITNQL
ncbi:hypothetical protein [Marivirga sp.]|uniref:hypothetical protein n=1 Tax=Marivirga sp. TaxID=2018662 RepID=UPI002D7EE366|nr:hypothetical protein [Marivirga sp.]HET8859987.1 hypothetical protein [Marivirga sp.]